MYQRILSPVDGSETAKRGMQEAIALARDQQAELRFLCVVDTYLPALDPEIAFDVGVLESLRKWGGKVLEQARAAAREQGVEAEVELIETAGGAWPRSSWSRRSGGPRRSS
jgi:nucleotide-binding universal stress UspA family protein